MMMIAALCLAGAIVIYAAIEILEIVLTKEARHGDKARNHR